jgi:hypothetical protein
MKFDQLIREGRDTDAVRLFARQYYERGKIGHTRMLLLVRVADEHEELTDRAEAAERANKRLLNEIALYDCCPPDRENCHCALVPQCRLCWREWAMKEGK